jgi:hypothetical protein
VGAPAGAGQTRARAERRTDAGADAGAGASPARSLLNGYGLLQFTPNRKKNPRSPELVKEKKNTRQFDTPDNTKKNRWGVFLQKTHKLNKKITYKRRHKAQNHTKRKYNNKIIKRFNRILPKTRRCWRWRSGACCSARFFRSFA